MSLTKALIADIENRKVGVKVSDRARSLQQALAVAGLSAAISLFPAIAQASPSNLSPGAQGAAMAQSMWDGAYAEWQNRQAMMVNSAASRENMQPVEHAEYLEAEALFNKLVLAAPETRLELTENASEIVKSTVVRVNRIENLKAGSPKPPAEEEKRVEFLKCYADDAPTLPVDPAFELVVRNECKKIGIYEPSGKSPVLNGPDIN